MKRSLFWDDVIPNYEGVENVPEKSQPYAKELVRSLFQFTTSITEKRIIAETKGRTIQLANALRALVKVGKVIRSGAGVKANPFKYQVKD